MKSGEGPQVPAGLSVAAGSLLAILLGGCMTVPDVDSDDPLVVTEAGVQPDPDGQSPERRAAVAEMRAKARQGDALPYPDAFQAERTAQLAARPEPLPVRSIEAIEAELAEVTRRQQGAVTPAELAALRAREAQLRRLAAQTQAAGAEARRNPAAPVLGR